MDFLRSVKQASVASLRQGLQIVHSVSAAATDLASAPSSFLFRKVLPEEELEERFKALCTLIDLHAAQPNAASLEGERGFYESKARDNVKEILRLIQVEDVRWVASHHSATAQTSDDLVYPCMSLFMGKHMMGELSSRANRDRPRGCMSLVLAMAASLLRYTRYPLLPNQSVHVPVSHLITNAMRISQGPSAETGADYHSADFQAYKQKLDYNLVTLVAVLWKKIMENPTLLDCFLFVDRRPQDASLSPTVPNVDGGGPRSRIRPQLDAISCLIPLMGKPKIGTYAKQAILNAIAIRDARIETFIVLETNMLDNVITELCKKYQKVVEVWSSFEGHDQAAMGPPKAVVLAPSSHAVDVGENAKVVRQSLDVFLRVLRFCHSINNVASEYSPHRSVDWGIYPRLSSLTDDRERSQSYSPPRNASFGHHYSSRGAEQPICSISSELSDLFRDLFLDVCLRSATSSSGSEQYVLSVQSLLRRIIAALQACEAQHHLSIGTKSKCSPGPKGNISPSLVRNRIALHELTANFFLSRPEFVGVLVARAGAVSKAVVISSLNLLSDLLATASLKDLVICVFANGANHFVSAQLTEPRTPTKGETYARDSDVLMFLEGFLKRPHVLRGASDAELTGVSKCLDYEYKDVPRNYVEAALVRLMARVDKLVNLRKLFEKFSHHKEAGHDELEWIGAMLDVGASLGIDELKPAKPPQSIIELVFRKLGNFVVLKFDEQIAVTSILCQLFCATATLCVVSSPKIPVSAKHFAVLGRFFEVLEQQLNSTSTHLTSMFPPGYDVLLEFAKLEMQRSPSKLKKPKELDDVRVQRAVESAVLLEGLLFELKAFIVSTVALRRQLSQDLSFSEKLNELSKLQSPVVASLRSGMKILRSSPELSPTVEASEAGSDGATPSSIDGWDLEKMEDFEFEEDMATSYAVKQMASVNLGQIDLLVKEIEEDISLLDEEFQALQISFSIDDGNTPNEAKPRSESTHSSFDDFERRLGTSALSIDESDVAIY